MTPVHDRPTTVDVTVQALSYSPVSGKREEGRDFWAETFAADQLPEAVVIRFGNYVRRAVLNQTEEFYEVDFESTEGKRLEKRLKAGLKLTETDVAARRDMVQLLADDLSKIMETVPKPTPGALFVVEALVEGKRAIGLLKLDLRQREVMALREERQHAFEHKVFERALSEDVKEMRKALLYPSPGDGVARTVQVDTDSDYWRRFAGARPLREGRRASTTTVGVGRELAASNGGITDRQIVTMLEKAQEREDLSVESLADLMKTTFDLPQRRGAIVDRLKREGKTISFRAVAPVKAFRYRFRGKLELSVPAEFIRDNVVVFSQDGPDVVIRIKQSSMEVFEQFV